MPNRLNEMNREAQCGRGEMAVAVPLYLWCLVKKPSRRRWEFCRAAAGKLWPRMNIPLGREAENRTATTGGGSGQLLFDCSTSRSFPSRRRDAAGGFGTPLARAASLHTCSVGPFTWRHDGDSGRRHRGIENGSDPYGPRGGAEAAQGHGRGPAARSGADHQGGSADACGDVLRRLGEGRPPAVRNRRFLFMVAGRLARVRQGPLHRPLPARDQGRGAPVPDAAQLRLGLPPVRLRPTAGLPQLPAPRGAGVPAARRAGDLARPCRAVPVDHQTAAQRHPRRPREPGPGPGPRGTDAEAGSAGQPSGVVAQGRRAGGCRLRTLGARHPGQRREAGPGGARQAGGGRGGAGGAHGGGRVPAAAGGPGPLGDRRAETAGGDGEPDRPAPDA